MKRSKSKKRAGARKINPRSKFELGQREYFRQRLSDPQLLDAAVPVWADGRCIGLAVPVGGARRGGYVSCCSIRWAKQAYNLLLERAGFPCLRIEYSPYRDACHSVNWGEQEPDTEDNKTIGRFYGYREEVLHS